MPKATCKQAKPRPPSIVTRPWDENTTPLHQAICVIAPWTKADYPGFHKAFLAVFPRRVTWDAMKHWLSGRTPRPGVGGGGVGRLLRGPLAG